MKKLYLVLTVIAVLSIATGCAQSDVLPSSKVNNSSIFSSIYTTSNTTTASSDPNKQVNTSSMTQSSNSTSSTLSSLPMISSGVPSEDLTQSELSQNAEGNKMDNNCTLIVNGRDITQECYVNFNQTRRVVELPITAIAKELGAKVEWQDGVATITFRDGRYIFDTTEEYFGVFPPPGSKYNFRKVVENDIIMDYPSAHPVITYGMDANIEINYDEKIVKIQSNNQETVSVKTEKKGRKK